MILIILLFIIHYSNVASAVWKGISYPPFFEKHNNIINNKTRIILLVVSERNADLKATISL